MVYDPGRKKNPGTRRPLREASGTGAPRDAEAAARRAVRKELPEREAEENNIPGASLVYGKNAVTELLKSGAGVDTVFVADSMAEQVAAYYTALAKDAGAVVKRVHTAKLRGMTGTDSHQGVACWASAIEYAEPEQMLAAAAEKGEDPLLVLADGVEDPHNLGAIIRTALLCGAHGVIIPKRGGAGITPTVAKSSAGAVSILPVARVANIGQTVRWLKEQNVFVYCAQMGGVTPYKQDLTGPIAVVMGSEGRGVSPLVQKLCDGTLSLPMAADCGGVDSFNVSVAAGMLLYEIDRQRTVRAEKE
ncbi:MAG: 23S rRNA (guanosine(2251)-2'-O)-methyltransferase RlmB [Oscillospiraceae bacterium]|nr:23S rRNA (guanosine(2251)-2'-O)-methyltransferase RlmB [Oscillospiraceae bacterium]